MLRSRVMEAITLRGTAGVAGATTAALFAGVASLAGGAALAQKLSLPPWVLLVVLVAAAALTVAVFKLIGTEATWTIEADALVRRTRRRETRFAWSAIESASFFSPDAIQPTPHVVVLTRDGRMVFVWGASQDQAQEVGAFCEEIQRRITAAPK